MLDSFLIKKPIVSEKASDLASLGQYVFMVKTGAKSAEIKKIIKKVYGVDVARVNIINIKAKIGRYGRIKTVKRSSYKKAIITLKKGQSIDLAV